MKVLKSLKKYIPNLRGNNITDFFRVDIISGDIEDIAELDEYSSEEIDSMARVMSFDTVREMGLNRLSVFTGVIKVTKSTHPDLQRNLRPQVLLNFLWEESDELLEVLYEEYGHFYGEGELELTKTRLVDKSIQRQSTVYVISTELSAEKWEVVIPDGDSEY